MGIFCFTILTIKSGNGRSGDQLPDYSMFEFSVSQCKYIIVKEEKKKHPVLVMPVRNPPKVQYSRRSSLVSPEAGPESSCRCCTGTGSILTHYSFTWSDKLPATNMTTRILLLITLIIIIFITPYFIIICFFYLIINYLSHFEFCKKVAIFFSLKSRWLWRKVNAG